MKKLGSFMSIVDLGLEFIDRNLFTFNFAETCRKCAEW